MAFLVYILLRRPKDQNHPYGHGKAEFLSAGVEGSLIIIAGIIIIYQSIYSFIYPHPIKKLDYGMILVALTAVINFGVGYISIKRGKKNNSLALVASGKHLQSDTYSTLGNNCRVNSYLFYRFSLAGWNSSVNCFDYYYYYGL